MAYSALLVSALFSYPIMSSIFSNIIVSLCLVNWKLTHLINHLIIMSSLLNSWLMQSCGDYQLHTGHRTNNIYCLESIIMKKLTWLRNHSCYKLSSARTISFFRENTTQVSVTGNTGSHLGVRLPQFSYSQPVTQSCIWLCMFLFLAE